MMIDAIGGRKVFVSLLAVAIGCGLVALKGDIPAGFLDLMKFLLGAFIAGNIFEHGADAYKCKHTAPTVSEPTPLPEESGLTAEVFAIKGEILKTQEGVGNIQATLIEIVKRIWPAQ